MTITDIQLLAIAQNELNLALARVESEQHSTNLRRVYFEINGRLTACLGKATVRGDKFGRIQISRKQLSDPRNFSDLIDTIRHELAHIMEPDAGHGADWKVAARFLGAKPASCGKLEADCRVTSNKTFEIACACCGSIKGQVIRQRQPRKYTNGRWQTRCCKAGFTVTQVA